MPPTGFALVRHWNTTKAEEHNTGEITVEREQSTNDDASEVSAPVRAARLVLIVDDERSIADALDQVVDLAGYESLVAYDGKQALDLVSQQWPALVLSDIMMPVMDGHKLVAALANQAAQWHLPMPTIVLLTAASSRAVVGMEVDVVVSKPFDIDTIEALLHRFLANGD